VHVVLGRWQEVDEDGEGLEHVEDVSAMQAAKCHCESKRKEVVIYY